MKLLIKILIAVLIIFVLLFSAAGVFVTLKGKALLTEKLEEALQRKVNVGYVGLKVPLALEIKDLDIENLAYANYIYASPGIIGLLAGKITFNNIEILEPQFNYELMPSDDKAALKDLGDNIEIKQALAQTRETLDSSGVGSDDYPPVFIKHLRVKKGVIYFTDYSVSKEGLDIIIEDVSLDIDNLSLLQKSAITSFQLNAVIPWRKETDKGIVYASGWLDLYKKDMQARFELEGVDGVYLYPYYSNWVDLEKARIEEARLNFTSDIQGQNNDVVAQCRLEITDIKFKPREPEEPEHKAEKIATAVIGIFRALNQGKIILNFTVKTKMDKPEFKFESINSAVDETISKAIKSKKAKAEDIASLPGRFIEGASDATKAIVEGAVSIGKTLLDAFKVEEEEEGVEEPAPSK